MSTDDDQQGDIKLQGHTRGVWCITFSPDGNRIVSGSGDKTLRIWDALTGKALGQPLQGHTDIVYSVAFSPDGNRIVSGSNDQTIRIWDAATGKTLGPPLQGHTDWVGSIAFSPDGKWFVSCSGDNTLRIWDTVTGRTLCSPLRGHTNGVRGIAVFPDGKRIVSGSWDTTLKIWDAATGEALGLPLRGHTAEVHTVACSPDGKYIVSGSVDKTIRMWDAVTGVALGSPFRGHTQHIHSIAVSPDSKLILSGSYDNTLMIWDGTTGQALCTLRGHDGAVWAVTFSPDGKWIVSASADGTLRMWNGFIGVANMFTIKVDDYPSVLACVLDAAKQCKPGEQDAVMWKWDLAIASSSKNIFSILLIKVITQFQARREETCIARVNDLIRLRPGLSSVSFQMIKAYMLKELAQKAFENDQFEQVVKLLSEALHDGDLSYSVELYYSLRAKIPSNEGLAIVTRLFGWNFETLRYSIHETQCETLRRMGRSLDAVYAVENMGKRLKDDERDKYMKWSAGFKHLKEDWIKEWGAKADQALEDGSHDVAIKHYSSCIELDQSNYSFYSNRSLAYASKQMWKEALNDAEKAIGLEPSLALGYLRKYYALQGAKLYDEAITAFKLFADKSTAISKEQFVTPEETKAKIKDFATKVLETMPPRLFETRSGIICNKGDMLRTFEESEPYKQLVSSTITRDQLDRDDSFTDIVNSYFRYAMLSHRWEEGEILLQDIVEGQSIYEMKSNSAGLLKLQRFCDIASHHGFHWAWSDTCCIDKKDSVETQESIVSMFQWYRVSPLTIVYLSDVEEFSSAAFTASKWFTRGWTLQELLAPPALLFYKRDWSLFWEEVANDDAAQDGHAMQHYKTNHKECDEILYMIEQVTEIDAEFLRVNGFQPGRQDMRQKLRWASRRLTTKVEDAAYSLFGVLDIQLSVMYGEKENALGRLLQEIVGQTGELAVLDWVGQRGKMHSCLPNDISCFKMTRWTPPLLNDTEVEAQMSSLQNSLHQEEIAKLAAVRQRLQYLPTPRFQQNRLSLPCIVYPVKTVTRQRQTQISRDHRVQQYDIKAKGLKSFEVQTMETMAEGSETRPPQQKYFVAQILRDDLLELLMKVSEEEETGVFEMIMALSLPFIPFLLVQRGKAYQRIGALEDMTTEVEDMLAVRAEGLNVRTLEVI